MPALWFAGCVFCPDLSQIADVSGFTKLNESCAALGASGAEKVTNHLNRYFTKLLDIIERVTG